MNSLFYKINLLKWALKDKNNQLSCIDCVDANVTENMSLKLQLYKNETSISCSLKECMIDYFKTMMVE